MKILSKSQAFKQLSILITKSQFDFFSEGKFWHIKNIPLQKKFNLIKAGLDNFFPGDVSLSQPSGCMIEPTNVCNLHCTGCWTKNESDNKNAYFLSVEGFKKIINDLGANLLFIHLWGWGEPFLNKNIYEMIRLARSKNIVVISSTHANLQFDDYSIENLMKSGLSKLIIAIDGIDQDTYSKYRIGGNLDVVLHNVKKLVEYKKRLSVPFPLINLRMVVMRHNQHQIEEFLTLGLSLGADIVSLKTMCDYRKDGVNAMFPTIKKYQRYAMDDESNVIDDIKNRYYCNRPWRRIHFFANGDITPCEFDFKREYLLGNIYNDQNLNSLWNNSTAKKFRYKFLTNIDKISFCNKCPYKNQIVWDPTVEFHYLTEAAKL